MALPLTFAASQFRGKVVGVSDGDTITVLVERRPMKVRLAEIDTPEKGQPYGARAKQALSELVFGKLVTGVEQTIDRYGRTVGRVYIGGLDVNAELVRGGHAWVYRQYAKDQNLYRLEAAAKTAGQGLWGLPEAQRVPPWEWRHRDRASLRVTNPQLHTAKESRGGFTCASKRFCREMTSCEEARLYTQKCGLMRLDGDSDGVPCETLCR